jgi:peptidyl-prolyl cis-trans isomerase A (cyclophilin A)/peptidyl-prolyl cis-trans isomerase B (cyclophilin B)
MAPKYNRKQPVKHQPKRNGSNKKRWLIIGFVALIVIVIGASVMVAQSWNIFNTTSTPTPTPTPTATPTATPSATTSPSANGTKVLLHTSMGDITIQLRTDKPITTANFVKLVQEGKYDGTVFHRIMDGFMIQGGSVNENLTPINDEIGTYNRNLPYTIAMAKTSAANSATSSFFINLVDNGAIDYGTATFDETYTAFGEVISGKNIVDAISKISVTENPYNLGEYSVPTQTITIISASIVS